MSEVKYTIAEWKLRCGMLCKKLRNERGMSVVDLAKAADLPEKWIDDLERIDICPSHKAVSKLSKALGVKHSVFDENEVE